jgi:hypothetical protein
MRTMIPLWMSMRVIDSVEGGNVCMTTDRLAELYESGNV